MNGRNISLGITFLVILLAIAGVFYFINKSTSQTLNEVISNPLMKRQVVQVPLIDNSTKQPSVEATKLPQFVFSLADQKFASILNAASGQISQLAKASIIQTVYGQDINADVSVDKNKKELIVTPQDVPNFTPGLYKISLSLRTIEGVVNINQDFTWGVIAVNTNKSIYTPGETAKIGIGVLDDKGNTLCKTGLFDKVDALSMVITDPQGNQTNFSLNDNTIRDSGQCAPNSVTNVADFLSTYTTTTSGIYEMKVMATVYGRTREIEDYFKVEPSVAFDVERTSFPTRIYPKAPYPVTFTVTASQNYQGTVTDIVPAFFGILHVDGGGQTQKDGSFTKIVWNADLTAGQPQTFSYFIQFPQVSPEFYLIGPIQIGTFQEARQWQIASDAINSDTGVFTAEDNGSNNTWYRTWTGTAWSPAPGTNPNSMSSAPGDSRWFKEVSSPITGEKLVGIEDNDPHIYVFRWDGTNWHQDMEITMTTTTTTSQYMDIGFNQISGNAMLVYCDSNQTQIHYDLYTDSSHTWAFSGTITSSSTLPAIGASTTSKAWVRLIPQPNSDNMLIGYLDTGNFVGGFIWDGDNQKIISGSEIVDSAGTTASGHTHESFAMAWETNDQVPMIMWATGSDSIVYRRFTGGAWSAESTTGLTGYAANVDWVSAASDNTPSSDNIAIGTQNVTATTAGCGFAVWNGSSWTQGTSTTCANDGEDRSINVAWEDDTGKAMWVFVSSANDLVLSYETWQSSTFSSISTISGTEPKQIRAVELYSDPNTVSIICLVVIEDDAPATDDEGVYDTEWNGTSWTTLPSATTANAPNTSLFDNVSITTDDQPEEAFGFGFDLNLETQAGYKWFANSPGTNTSVNTALGAQDTPTTLTSANEQFRLRMLLYYPDSLASAGRSYILQYVDPGSGSCASPGGDGNPANWANVPSTTDPSSTVAFYDNTSVSSASAITTNASLDPTLTGSTLVGETYNEQNTFTTDAPTSGTNVGEFDFSLVDKTTFGRTAHTFCFRVERSTGVVLKISFYPELTTAALNDVQVRGGTLIRPGTTLR